MSEQFNRILLRVTLPIALVAAAAMTARAFDTSWISSGSPVSAANMKGNLDEIQNRLAALEASSPAMTNSTRVYRNTSQSIPNDTNTAISFNTVRYDYGTQWLTNSPTRLTAKAAGIYMIGFCVEYLFNATGSRQASVVVNGTTYIANQLIPQNTINTPSQCVSTVYQLAVNDYVEAIVYQASGGALNITATGDYAPELWMHKLR